MCEPDTHDDVNATATLGPRGLGLILAKEDEGRGRAARWFWLLPNGEPNPGAASLLFFVLFFLFIACLRSLDH